MILILFFSINAAYIGTRLGLCWEILSELGFDEFSQNNHVRDPYPLIAEKSGSLKGYRIGKALRYLASGTYLFLCFSNSICTMYYDYRRNHCSEISGLCFTANFEPFWSINLLFLKRIQLRNFFILACIIITLYGSACVFIILISDFITELSHQALSKCLWMVIVAVTICPLTWFGTPKDFW